LNTCSDVLLGWHSLAGIVHDKLNETIKSIGFHERHLAIGERTNDDAAKLTANRHLVEVYRTLADQHDKKGEIDAALACLRKSLHAASQIDEPKAEGASYHKLSLALLKRGDVDAAIENAKSFLAICKQNGDQLGEGAACSALAQCYQAVKKTELAVQYLESFLDIGMPDVWSIVRIFGQIFQQCSFLCLQPRGTSKCSSKQRRVVNSATFTLPMESTTRRSSISRRTMNLRVRPVSAI
jgi:tetratricopeptide (TPR) repeat protein